MRRIFFAALFCLFIFSIVFGQDGQSEAQKLNQQMITAFEQGNLDESASIAERIVKIQRDTNSAAPQNLITALENLAQIKLLRFKRRVSELSAPDLKPNDAAVLLERMQKDGTETEAIYREILGLAKDNANIPTEQTVGVKTNLAWLLYNFFPKEANIPVGFDKQSKDKFDSLNKARFYKRINEAESLFSEGLKNSETVFGEENAVTILSRYKFAEFQMALGNLEEAISNYQKCIAAVEKGFGQDSQDLLLPLESYLKILVAAGQEDLAFEALSRIVQLTKKTAQFPKTLLNLSLRADKSFNSVNSPSVERREQENNNNAYLGERGAVIRSGATGGTAAELTLNASTFSKLYYENSNEIRVIKIPVRVLVDETGKVIEAEGLTENKEYKESAEKIVREWKFRPFSGAQPTKLKGYVECLFLAERFIK